MCPPIADNTPRYNSHYKAMAIEPLEIMQTLLTPEEYIGFLKGNIIKYAMRQGTKRGESAAKDAAKARDYNRLLAEYVLDTEVDL